MTAQLQDDVEFFENGILIGTKLITILVKT